MDRGGIGRAIKRPLICVVACALGAMLPVACSPAGADPVPNAVAAHSAESGQARARVLVTTDFGAQTIVDSFVPLDEGATAMQALKSVADIGTAYGGGFVQSINGIGGSRAARMDWFYAVNGVLANAGAADHVLRDGDVEHWDYRQWRFRRNVSATLSCYPAFFLNGYSGRVRPTVIAFESQYESDAALIEAALKLHGVGDVNSVELGSLPQEWREERNLIVVAGPEHAMVREVYGIWDRLGLFSRLADGTVEVYTSTGELAETFGAATGILEATQNPWNPSGIGVCENVVLLVTGTDARGVRDAVAALVGYGDVMAAWCGAVVRDGAPLSVPAGTA